MHVLDSAKRSCLAGTTFLSRHAKLLQAQGCVTFQGNGIMLRILASSLSAHGETSVAAVTLVAGPGGRLNRALYGVRDCGGAAETIMKG